MPDHSEHQHQHGLNIPFIHPHEDVQHEIIPTNPAWETVKIARNINRPHTLDYLNGSARIFSDFVEFHGDKLFGDDPAIIGGIAAFEGQTVIVIGHQKGRTTKENVNRRFGMARAEGYRKAQRIMKHAARFGFPIITFLDTPGADPSIESEDRGIGQAIAANIHTMLTLEVPIIATVIGEGGSGGALGIGVGDRILMLENSVYSVASPEAMASILWRDANYAPEAARVAHITAQDLKELKIIDEIIPEPPGGAHTDPMATAVAVKEAISRHLAELKDFIAQNHEKGPRMLLEMRREKYKNIGAFSERVDEELNDSDSGTASTPAETEAPKKKKK